MRGATADVHRYSRRNDFNPRTPCGVRRHSSWASQEALIDFNPRTPCGVRLALRKEMLDMYAISIHAPHAGCDHRRHGHLRPHQHFNPRTPCGVRLNEAAYNPRISLISIHAPHAGCDYASKASASFSASFQSTHPMRGATK